MKKLLLMTGIILTAYLGITSPLSSAGEPVAVIAEVEATEGGFLVGVSQGRVAVFRGGELYLKTDTSVSSLPRADRTRLEQGIYLDSEKELKQLLQDLCS